jgi:hypothetical protein
MLVLDGLPVVGRDVLILELGVNGLLMELEAPDGAVEYVEGEDGLTVLGLPGKLLIDEPVVPTVDLSLVSPGCNVFAIPGTLTWAGMGYWLLDSENN